MKLNSSAELAVSCNNSVLPATHIMQPVSMKTHEKYRVALFQVSIRKGGEGGKFQNKLMGLTLSFTLEKLQEVRKECSKSKKVALKASCGEKKQTCICNICNKYQVLHSCSLMLLLYLTSSCFTNLTVKHSSCLQTICCSLGEQSLFSGEELESPSIFISLQLVSAQPALGTEYPLIFSSLSLLLLACQISPPPLSHFCTLSLFFFCLLY